MPWNEPSLPDTSGSMGSNMTVKVRAWLSRGWGVVESVPQGFTPSVFSSPQGQNEDPSSLLSLFRRLSDQRGKERSLLHGDFHVLSSSPGLFSYVRHWDQNERFLVVLNFGDVKLSAMLGASALPASARLPAQADLLLSTQPGREKGASLELGSLSLGPHEGLLLRFPYEA